jgi:hypothetical protein
LKFDVAGTRGLVVRRAKRARTSHHENQHCERRPYRGRFVRRPLTAKDAANAAKERAVSRGKRESTMGCDRHQFRQRRHIQKAIAAYFDRKIVAAVLAFFPHLRRYPPHRGVIEQQRFNHGLQKINQVVVTTDVRELVGEDRLQLFRREAGKGRGREQHHRFYPTNQGRYGNGC